MRADRQHHRQGGAFLASQVGLVLNRFVGLRPLRRTQGGAQILGGFAVAQLVKGITGNLGEAHAQPARREQAHRDDAAFRVEQKHHAGKVLVQQAVTRQAQHQPFFEFVDALAAPDLADRARQGPGRFDITRLVTRIGTAFHTHRATQFTTGQHGHDQPGVAGVIPCAVFIDLLLPDQRGLALAERVDGA